MILETENLYAQYRTIGIESFLLHLTDYNQLRSNFHDSPKENTINHRERTFQILEKCYFYVVIILEKCKKTKIFALEKCILFTVYACI